MKHLISFIIPTRDEEKSIRPLYEEIAFVVKKIGISCEIIFVDDGSEDDTFSEMEKIFRRDKRVKVVVLRGKWGKSVALQAGFINSRGNIVITIDADLQDNPKEIPNFLAKLDSGYDLVVGWKKVRRDPILKVISSRVFNFFSRLVTGVKLHDVNCGFRAFRREVIDDIVFYGDLFRFVPIIAAKRNFRVAEIVVRHRIRKYGKSKFGIERAIKGFLDLLTVFFLTSYLTRPGHFFGFLGLVSFLMGFLIGLYITYLRVTTGSIQYRHPLLFLGILLMVVGVQLVTSGLLAEMITNFFQKPDSSKNYIKEVL